MKEDNPQQNLFQTGTRSQAIVLSLAREAFPPARIQDALGVFDIQEFSRFSQPIVIPSSCATFKLKEDSENRALTVLSGESEHSNSFGLTSVPKVYLPPFNGDFIHLVSSEFLPLAQTACLPTSPSDSVTEIAPDISRPGPILRASSRSVILDWRH